MNAKLGRKNKHRVQMLKNLAVSVLIYEKVTTTAAKAKEVRKIIDYAINTAKNHTLASRRNLQSTFLHNKNVVNKLLDDLALRYKNTPSGYTRLFKNNFRVGDGAPTITIILTKSKFISHNIKIDEQTKKTNDKKDKIKP